MVRRRYNDFQVGYGLVFKAYLILFIPDAWYLKITTFLFLISDMVPSNDQHTQLFFRRQWIRGISSFPRSISSSQRSKRALVKNNINSPRNYFLPIFEKDEIRIGFLSLFVLQLIYTNLYYIYIILYMALSPGWESHLFWPNSSFVNVTNAYSLIEESLQLQ